jgi:hypothetical protein
MKLMMTNCLIGNDREMLAVNLNVGEHFAIFVVEDNDGSDDFWIFTCEKKLVMVAQDVVVIGGGYRIG